MRDVPVRTVMMAGGDGTARPDTLREEDLRWIRRKVSQRLNASLRRLAETEDYVQDVLVRALRYAGQFRTADRGRLRALLARIVENVLADAWRRSRAKKRSLDGDFALLGETVVDLDAAAVQRGGPATEADRAEREAQVRLAMQMLGPEQREILWLRHLDELSYQEIGAQLGIQADAARMRANRAFRDLATAVRIIREGRIDELLGRDDDRREDDRREDDRREDDRREEGRDH